MALESVFDEGLILKTEGISLKTKTRNYPHTCTADKARRTASEARNVYCDVGSELSSPEALSGMLQLADSFTRRAEKLPHIYRNAAVGITIVLLILYVEIVSSLLGISITKGEFYKNNYTKALIMASVPVFAFIGWWFGGRCFPGCGKTYKLTQKLKSMEPFVDLCEISNEEFTDLFDERNHGVCDYKLVGSAGDGFGFFASQGSNKHLLQDKAVLTQDIDLNIFLNAVSVEEKNLRPVVSATGFTHLRFTKKAMASITDPIISQSLVKDPTSKKHVFLSAAAVSRQAARYIKSNEMLNRQAELIEHFPALTLKMDSFGPNGMQKYEVDYAFALRYPHWPKEASEWIGRERSGIDDTTIQNISQRGCYLVHKECGQDIEISGKPHEHDLDWRLTFASAEADLFHYHRDKKALKMAFVILKFLIKYETRQQGFWDKCFAKYSCRVEERFNFGEIPVLRTYHLKTIFLWMAEEKTYLDYYTIKDNSTLKDVFLEMLERYHSAVISRKLPNFFIRSRNMLGGSRYSDEDFAKADKLLETLLKRPTLSIQENFEKQFMNMKIMAVILIAWLVLYYVGMAGFVYLEFTADRSPYVVDLDGSGYPLPSPPTFPPIVIPTIPDIDWDLIRRTNYRPAVTAPNIPDIDWDHIRRTQDYVDCIREKGISNCHM